MTKPTSRIRQSVSRWCFDGLTLEQLAEAAARIGYSALELIEPEELATVQSYGLTCASIRGFDTIEDGLNDPENHERCARSLRRSIEFAASAGIPNVLCFSGNRRGMPDDEGLENCAAGVKPVLGLAEKLGVDVCLELLNSKVDHPDYMADRTAWGVRLVEMVGSPRFKLLYDIYHMQVMEGDVIQTIRTHSRHFCHYHTAGVPGRNEIDGSQELNYPAIVRAILETGYDGFLGQEFVPARDPLTSLEEAFRICAV